MRNFLIVLALLGFVGYMGIARLMESLTFESLPGQIARASAFTIWNAVAAGTTSAPALPMNEIQGAIDFNPKIKLVSFKAQAEQITESRAEGILKESRDAYRQAWPVPLQKGEVPIHFHAAAEFSVESSCVPFIRRKKDFHVEVVTFCPIRTQVVRPASGPVVTVKGDQMTVSDGNVTRTYRRTGRDGWIISGEVYHRAGAPPTP